MIITTTQIFTISPENEPFVELIIQKAGGKISEEETTEQAINRIVAQPFHKMTRSMVVPTLYEYFGMVGKANADALVELIDNGALETTLEITESVV